MKRSIYLAGIVLLFAACDNKDDKVDPVPVPATKECRLVKMAAPGGGELNITYNAAGYVIKRETAGTPDVATYTYTYNSQDQLIKEVFSENGIVRSEVDYVYANGLLVSNTTKQGSAVNQEQYIYDNNQRLIEVKNIPASYDFRSVYEYDSKGNVIRITAFTNADTMYKSTYGNYDDKPNFYGTLKGLNIPDEVHDLEGLGKIMKNNPGTVKHVSYSYQSGGVVQHITDANDTYTYTYNENNLPATANVRYKSGNEYKINLSYDCH